MDPPLSMFSSFLWLNVSLESVSVNQEWSKMWSVVLSLLCRKRPKLFPFMPLAFFVHLWHELDLNLYTPIWEEEEAGSVLTRHSIGDCLVLL